MNKAINKTNNNSKRTLSLQAQEQGYVISFNAMASPCEVLIQTKDHRLAKQVASAVSDEVWRIEDKFSRYNKDSVCYQINNNAGQSMAIDEECYLLLNFAEQCYQLSEGVFDISAGILNQVWHFDGSDNIATKKQVAAVLPLVGWHKVSYQHNSITLPQGMALDFGGIGKEYAVDRGILLSQQITALPVLVNLGGDLAVTGPRLNGLPWQVAIESTEYTKPNSDNNKEIIVALTHGALATSGDSKRFLVKDGQRYSHVLNALTGWPIEQAPRSITTLAPQCLQAGMLATLALLQGKGAEQFLSEQEVTYWARR
ncbi:MULTISPECIES: FAD:protein FMN transferase [Colwellia]|uniref:FAD:protein FMN transferase n=1 Tax=Colwellia marinimaniae TaxID=1513592 RepID=A0ABQ0MV87_9GAMM|nr:MULTISPECIES: FAD:protein FMN transferase [Colwellia]GAW96242.1 FAD:protein FMN transferase [Colwellia marinimaniae]